MGIESAMLLEEAAEELRKLIVSISDMDQALTQALGGELLEAYQELYEKTEHTAKTVQSQLLELAAQSMLEM